MSKIQGKFYPLQHKEWIEACKKLTPAERDTLYYIRTLDPYNNGIEVTAAKIARDLSTEERKIHRQTISRALKQLDKLGFIDLEIISARINIQPKGALHEPEAKDSDGVSLHQWCGDTPGAIATHQDGSLHTKVDRHTPEAIATHQAKAESPAQERVENSKTYLDFIKTLSDSERESFLKFAQEKAKAMPNPPQLVDAWIAKHHADLHKQFIGSAAGKEAKKKAIASSKDWRNDPRFGEWIKGSFERSYEWVQENEAEREERHSFHCWAQFVNAYEGVCY